MIRIALWMAGLLALAACETREGGYPARSAPAGRLAEASQIAAGRALFHRDCAVCHGKPGEGRSSRADFFQPPAPDFTAPVYQSQDPAYLFWRIETGKTVEPYLSRGSVMPAWGPFYSEEQIWQLVAYLRSRSR